MFLDQVSAIIREVGAAEVVPRFRSLTAGDVTEKGPGDLVTIADRECERVLTHRLRAVRDVPVVWLDVGHNPLAAQAVARAVGDAMRAEGIECCRCVLGMLADKDVATVGEELAGVISAWYCAGIGSDRGQSGATLTAFYQVGQ